MALHHLNHSTTQQAKDSTEFEVHDPFARKINCHPFG
jgi:hypothetical protein